MMYMPETCREVVR